MYHNDVKFDTLDITCSVPQGSILGSKLFILYINDMVNVSKLFKFIIFANDTNLFFRIKILLILVSWYVMN